MVIRALAWLLLLPICAHAAEIRHALVLGANRGDVQDVTLEYAERDAGRVAEVLTRLGGVAPENLVLLRAPDADEVRRVLKRIDTRIAAAKAQDPKALALLLIYYSGHADTYALHLGGSELPFKALRDAVASSAAEVSVLVVDACRSGGLTRVKGAVRAQPFEMQVDDNLQSSGYAIITSSAAGEDAQESERLRGGIFTHHLVSGLQGAADVSGDRRVTLSEAFRYASAQTLRTTSRLRYVQHPTYQFRIKGRRELTLTWLRDAAGWARLRLESPGRYVVLARGRDGDVLSDVDTEARAELLLPEGRYLVRRRGPDAVQETTVALAGGEVEAVRADEMDVIPYGRTVRKGTSATGRSWRLAATADLAGPTGSGLSAVAGGAVAAQIDLAAVSLQARARYGFASATNPDVSLDQHLVGGDVGAFKLFDVVGGGGFNLGLGAGVRGGADWLAQRFTGPATAPDRDQLVFRAAPVLRLEVSPSASWVATVDCGADIYVLREVDGAGTPVSPFCSLGLGAYP